MTKPVTGRDVFMGKLQPFFTEHERQLVLAAYVLAKYGHRGQMRDEGIRYFEHPRAVAEIIITKLKITTDWQIIAAALLHDVWEDSWILSEWLTEHIFGRDVARWVKFLTKEPDVDYYNRLICAPWQVKVIKLCDRLHNLRTLGGCAPEKQRKQIAETKQKYLPLAEALAPELPKAYQSCAAYLIDQMMAACRQYEAEAIL